MIPPIGSRSLGVGKPVFSAVMDTSNRFNIPELTKPGLFITGTDTGVGKTVVTAAIARSLARHGRRVGVCKPFATGCRKDREGLVSEDAETLAYFASFDSNIGGLPLVSPLRWRDPVAPAVAMESLKERLDPEPIGISLSNMDRACDVLLVEGIGGAMVPLDSDDPRVTVVDFARELGFPVVVVCRSTLGTLNHTAMTCAVLRHAGVKVAGLVVNYYRPDDPDPAMQTNRTWLSRMNGVPILATVPETKSPPIVVQAGWMNEDVLAAISLTAWESISRRQTRSWPSSR